MRLNGSSTILLKMAVGDVGAAIYGMCQLLLWEKSPVHPDEIQVSCGKKGIGRVSLNLSQRLEPGAAF